MRAIFKLLTGALAVAIALPIALVFEERSEGARLQERFFEAALSAEPDRMLAMLHPTLREKIDEPLIAQWMELLRDRLGELRGVSGGTFLTAQRGPDGLSTRVSEGSAVFERGQAASKLTFNGDLLTAFQIDSPQIQAGSYELPSKTEYYRARGGDLLRLLLRGRFEEARSLLHPTLREELPVEALEAQMSALLERTGRTAGVRFADEDVSHEGGLTTLSLRYEIEGENGTFEGEVKFQFAGLKGHLRAFNIKAVPLPGA